MINCEKWKIKVSLHVKWVTKKKDPFHAPYKQTETENIRCDTNNLTKLATPQQKSTSANLCMYTETVRAVRRLPEDSQRTNQTSFQL